MEDFRVKNFWSKVEIKLDTECWNFRGSKNKKGYGKFWTGSKLELAHRLAWRLSNDSDIPKRRIICHHCDNPSCCNPKHIYCGTYGDNNLDLLRRKRYNVAHHLRAKFYAGEIWLIQRLRAKAIKNSGKRGYNPSLRKIAKMFKTSSSVIHRICMEGYKSKGGHFILPLEEQSSHQFDLRKGI